MISHRRISSTRGTLRKRSLVRRRVGVRRALRSQTSRTRRSSRAVEPTLWPETFQEFVPFSERVVIHSEAASFLIMWAILSGVITAIGLLILFRLPII